MTPEKRVDHLRLVPRTAADAPPLPDEEPGKDLEPIVYEGEVVPPAEEERQATKALQVRTIGPIVHVPPSEKAIKVVSVLAVEAATVASGWHSWWVRAWDGLFFGTYRKQIRAADAVGNQEAVALWQDRKEQAVQRRRDRLLELPKVGLSVLKVAVSIVALLLVLIPLVALLVWMTGGDGFAVFRWVGGFIAFVFNAILFLLVPAVIAGVVALLAASRREGQRKGGNTLKWLATSADSDVDVRIDEVTITAALAALRIQQINAYLKQKLPLQFLVSARKDGRGTYAEVRLPTGVPAEDISKPAKRAALATGLYRATKEVWPSTGSEAGILKLWVADKGALAEGAGPYPLLTEGVVNVFKGVPFGKTLKGDPIVAPLMERNTITGGMPGQGKSSSARVIMAGAALDPTAELRIAIPDTNFDFEVFRRRCSRYVMGAEDEKIEWILWDLRELYEEVQARGGLLVEHEEPAVTRALASAGVGLHPLFYLLEEAHLAIQHKEHGDEISQLLCDIVKLGRKRGIHMIVSTQAPTKDSMPRDVTRNCSNGIAFAVGDHVANDALLGQGAYRAGHRATELIPGTDIGTAVVKGFTGERSDLVQAYFLSVSKRNDQVTPIIDRSLAEIEKRGTGLPGKCRPPAPPVERDLLEDLAEVLGAEPIGAANVTGLLVNLAPQWQPYKTLTIKTLVDRLATLGVKVPSTGNRWLIDPEEIRRALAWRSGGDPDGSGGAS